MLGVQCFRCWPPSLYLLSDMKCESLLMNLFFLSAITCLECCVRGYFGDSIMNMLVGWGSVNLSEEITKGCCRGHWCYKRGECSCNYQARTMKPISVFGHLLLWNSKWKCKIKWEFSAITGKFSHILIVWKTNFVVSVHVHWTIYENCFGVLIIGVELLDPLPGFDLGLNVGPVMHWSKSSREPGICCIWWQLAFLSVGTISPNNTLDLFFSVRVFFFVRK